MPKLIGSNFNVSDESITPSGILVGSDVAVTLVPSTPIDKPHIRVSFFNPDKEDVFLRFYPAGQDNEKRGEVLRKDTTLVIELPNMPTTEISAIREKGGEKDVYVQYI